MSGSRPNRKTTKGEKLCAIHKKICQIVPELKAQYEVDANATIYTEHTEKFQHNDEILPKELILTRKRGSIARVCGNDELYYLVSLYNAIAKSKKNCDEILDTNELQLSSRIVVNHYVNRTSKFKLPDFLFDNGLDHEYFEQFANLSNFIDSLDNLDIRKEAAQEVYKQAYWAYHNEWLTGSHKDLILENLRATNHFLRLKNPTQEDFNEYQELAAKTNSIGKWRLFSASMLALLSAVLIGAFVGLALTPILWPVTMPVLGICVALAALSMTGGALFALPSLFIGNPVTQANRTRMLGNDMATLASRVDENKFGAQL